MQPQVFNFNSHSIRTVTLPNGEPGFVGKDVCEVLGYANPTDAMNDHCRDGVKRYPILDSLGRKQSARVLSDQDVYCLIIGSSQPTAAPIKQALMRQLSGLREVLSALSDFEVPEECADMYVYAIRNTATGNIKLGISRNPEQRLKQLQTGNDCKLELVAYSKAENRFKDETALHHAHSAAHIRGEWFNESAATAIAQ